VSGNVQSDQEDLKMKWKALVYGSPPHRRKGTPVNFAEIQADTFKAIVEALLEREKIPWRVLIFRVVEENL